MSLGENASSAAASLRDDVWAQAFGDLLPVDPAWIATQLGVRVYVVALDRDIAGMLRKEPGADPEMFVNAEDSLARRRFTCAHELGHYMRRGAQATGRAWGYLDRRDSLSSAGTDPDERWANAFAAELLMPARRVRSERRRESDPFVLARVFGVSPEAMGYRLTNLGLA